MGFMGISSARWPKKAKAGRSRGVHREHRQHRRPPGFSGNVQGRGQYRQGRVHLVVEIQTITEPLMDEFSWGQWLSWDTQGAKQANDSCSLSE